MRWSTATKVGLFTVVGIFLFIFAVLFLNKVALFAPPTMDIVGRFHSVTGLKAGNSVRYSGVPVGKVKSIKVTPEGVWLHMKIKKDVEIPVDSDFSIQTDGLLGEKFVGISPGKAKVFLKDGMKVVSYRDNDMDVALSQMNRVMREAEKLLASINKLVGDQNTQDALKRAAGNTDAITSNMASITAQFSEVMYKNTQNINLIARNMVQISRNLNRITNRVDGALNNIDGDGKSSANLRDMIENMEETSQSLRKMAHSLEGVTNDEQTVQDLKETLHNTAHISGVISSLTGGKLTGVDGRVGVEEVYNTKRNEFSTNLNMHVFADKQVLGLGASHIGDGTAWDLNGGREIAPNFTVRAGLFESNVGIGMDWGLRNKPFSFSLAAMNPNDWRYRLRTEWHLFGNFSAVGIFSRPYSYEHGGDYFGVRYDF